jgi:hypothetical protein
VGIITCSPTTCLYSRDGHEDVGGGGGVNKSGSGGGVFFVVAWRCVDTHEGVVVAVVVVLAFVPLARVFGRSFGGRFVDTHGGVAVAAVVVVAPVSVVVVVVVAAVAPVSAVVVVGLLGVAILVVGAHVLIVVVAAGVSGLVGVGAMGVGAVGVGAVVVAATVVGVGLVARGVLAVRLLIVVGGRPGFVGLRGLARVSMRWRGHGQPTCGQRKLGFPTKKLLVGFERGEGVLTS